MNTGRGKRECAAVVAWMTVCAAVLPVAAFAAVDRASDMAAPQGVPAAGGDSALPTGCPAPGLADSAGQDVFFPGAGEMFTLPPVPADELPPGCRTVEPPAAPLPPPRPPAPDVFGLAAVPAGASLAAGKWDDGKLAELDGTDGDWNELLQEAGRIAGSDPLDMVNHWVNWHVRYQDDVGGDEWADARETLQRGYGDCEDFAIAKMALLARLGVPRDDMFLVLVRERARPVDHAVLAVRRDGRLLILDNRVDRLERAEDVTDYIPTFGYTGGFAWIYGSRVGQAFSRR
ncbi:transglutaminase-like cysteine peptidase [Novosphingobium sp. ZN18A2]|uniref:transglutaminase-like cysteine peptidase n=1 Tax=Novosphingobium sp. ZN18A2 TaxID=3079861 RepID=UPI0030CC3703